MHNLRRQHSLYVSRLRHGLWLALAGAVLPLAGPVQAQTVTPPRAAAVAQNAAAPGVPFSPEKLGSMLPQTVYFQGRSAPIQLRNAAGVEFANGEIVWAALVDNSGYASATQQVYQFYMVTEGPLRVGSARIAPGAYGGGFVGDRFVLMDIGGHKVVEGPTQIDQSITRPRPLQMLPRSSDEVVLALGRRTGVLHAE